MHQTRVNRILTALNSIILGKEEEIRLSLTALLARGHLLLEDLPGMGKTTLSHAFANILGLEYQRIQFTSDLLPGDILGGAIFNPKSQQFALHKGPIFTEVLLADEINRTTPKSQSALLEAMEERQVSLNNQTYPLSDFFFVIATQNPHSSGSGTFPLPESQLDRFMMRLSLGYPSYEAEMQILKGEYDKRAKGITPLLSKEELHAMQKGASEVAASDAVLDYILRLVATTRTHEKFQFGISPRGSQAILSAAKAYAFIMGRDYLIPDDVRAILPAVAGHRLRDHHQLEGDNRSLVDWLLDTVPVIE